MNSINGTARDLAPPHDLEAERATLGGLMSAPAETIHHALGMLQAEDYYHPQHANIFRCVMRLYEQGLPVETYTVQVEAKAAGLPISDAGALSEMVSVNPARSTFTHKARLVRDCKIKRDVLAAASGLMEAGMEPGMKAGDLVELVEAKFYDIAVGNRAGTTTMRPIGELVRDEMNATKWRAENPDEMMGFTTGFKDLDMKLRGLRRKNMYIIGGRPGMGKSALGLNIAEMIAVKHGDPGLLRIMEMSHAEVMRRFLSSVAGVNNDRIEEAQNLTAADWACLEQAEAKIGGWRIEVDENPNTTVADIRAKTRLMKSLYKGLGYVMVDYAQLMQGRAGVENRRVEMDEVSRQLKNLAVELDIVVIVLVQLNRNVESRSDKRPLISDIREAGGFEQDATAIMLLYRDEVYDPASDDQGIAEVHLVKNRFGKLGMVKLQYRGYLTRFGDLARYEKDTDNTF